MSLTVTLRQSLNCLGINARDLLDKFCEDCSNLQDELAHGGAAHLVESWNAPFLKYGSKRGQYRAVLARLNLLFDDLHVKPIVSFLSFSGLLTASSSLRKQSNRTSPGVRTRLPIMSPATAHPK